MARFLLPELSPRHKELYRGNAGRGARGDCVFATYLAKCSEISGMEGERGEAGRASAHRNASIKMQSRVLPSQRRAPLRRVVDSFSSPFPSDRRLLLFLLSFITSLNNRTAASGGRHCGVTSKRPFRKMQMHVPLSRLRYLPSDPRK